MLKRGEVTSVYANQGDRDAVILSVVMSPEGHHMTHKWAGQALLEYTMPRGRTFLRVLPLNEYGDPLNDGYPVSYDNIPVKFLLDMREHKEVMQKLLAGGFYRPDTVRRGEHAAFEREAKRAAIVRQRVLDLPPFYV